MRLKRAAWFFIFFGIFLLLFLPYPLKNSFPGNTDTQLTISLSNLIFEKIRLFLTGAPPFTVYYPAKSLLAYGENCYGLSFMFLFFEALTRSEVWGYYLFIATILALNSFAVSELSRLFVRRRGLSFLAGLMFSLAAFTLANIDDPNVIFILFPVLGLRYLFSGARNKSTRELSVGLALSGVQIWFGFYVFIFQALVIALFIFSHFQNLKHWLKPSDCLMQAFTYVLPALPLVCIYFYNGTFQDVFTPYDARETALHASLNWRNFLNVMPHNILYDSASNYYGPYRVSAWHNNRKNCFIGVLAVVSALLGWVTRRGKPSTLTLIFLVFFTLSFGLNLPFFDAVMSLPFGIYFRVPLRLFLFAQISICVFSVVGLEFILDLPRRRSALQVSFLSCTVIAAAGTVFFLENVPFPMPSYNLGDYQKPPPGYVAYFNKFNRPQIIVDLPSTCFYLPGGRGSEGNLLWFYNRDMLYMNWQTYHHQWILNGVNGYVPKKRAELDEAFQKIPEKSALKKIADAGTQYIVFHKNLILNPVEDVLARLKSSPNLSLVHEEGDLSIFQIKLNLDF